MSNTTVSNSPTNKVAESATAPRALNAPNGKVELQSNVSPEVGVFLEGAAKSINTFYNWQKDLDNFDRMD